MRRTSTEVVMPSPCTAAHGRSLAGWPRAEQAWDPPWSRLNLAKQGSVGLLLRPLLSPAFGADQKAHCSGLNGARHGRGSAATSPIQGVGLVLQLSRRHPSAARQAAFARDFVTSCSDPAIYDGFEPKNAIRTRECIHKRSVGPAPHRRTAGT